MADEPSWDDIFAGPAAQKREAEREAAGRVTPDDMPAPMTRRELRERERLQRQADDAPEPVRADSVGSEPVRADSVGSEPVRADPVGSEPVSADPVAAGSTSADHVAADPVAADPAVADLFAAEPVAHESAHADTVPTRVAPKRSGRPPRPPRAERPPRPHGHRRGAIILVIVLVVVLGGGTAGGFAIWNQYGAGVSALFGKKPSDDYAGSGDGKKVQFTIVSGDIGSTISKNLAKAHITKTSDAAYKLLLADQNISFQPGTYTMYEHMSAQSAIDRLQTTAARITTKLVIPEGTSLKGIISLMASATKIPVATVTKAADDYKSYGLPSNATSLEGYLFPATYDLQPHKTANYYFQQMVDTMTDHLTAAGVPQSQWEHTVVFASLIQKEAGLAADYPKVARVFQNRIDQGMLLQSDATVAYGDGTTDSVTTTDAQRADASNKYNTYVHKGLPPGPISNPGDIAIQAALHPATGSWLYFVTVNLETGQTVFSTTYAEHQKAVTQFQSWLRAHPSYQ